MLKGPAAATLYGTEAARGVINIITKKGAAGSTKYSFAAANGENWFQNAAGRFPTNYWINPKDNTLHSINYVKSEDSAGRPLFRTGDNESYDASVSGGSGLYRFFAAGQWMNNEGIVSQNSRNQKSARTNLSVIPSSKFDLETNVGYVQSKTYTTFEGSGGGIFFTGEYAEPQRQLFACAVPYVRGCGWSRGGMSSPPEVYMAQTSWQDVKRFTGQCLGEIRSVPVDVAPPVDRHRLRARGSSGYTPYQTDSVIVFFLGSNFDGSRSETTQQTQLMTYDYAGSVHFNLRPTMQSKTTGGVQYYTNISVSARRVWNSLPDSWVVDDLGDRNEGHAKLELPRRTTRSASTASKRSRGAIACSSPARCASTTTARSVATASWVTYPKLSASWVATEEPRSATSCQASSTICGCACAYGGSGQQPAMNSALRTLSPVAGPNGQTRADDGNVGNPDLKPERVSDTETGFEAGCSRTESASISRTTTTSRMTRFCRRASRRRRASARNTSSSMPARSTKHGVEPASQAQMIDREDYGWDMQFNVATNTSKIITSERRAGRHEHRPRHGAAARASRRLFAVRLLHVRRRERDLRSDDEEGDQSDVRRRARRRRAVLRARDDQRRRAEGVLRPFAADDRGLAVEHVAVQTLPLYRLCRLRRRASTSWITTSESIASCTPIASTRVPAELRSGDRRAGAELRHAAQLLHQAGELREVARGVALLRHAGAVSPAASARTRCRSP